MHAQKPFFKEKGAKVVLSEQEEQGQRRGGRGKISDRDFRDSRGQRLKEGFLFSVLLLKYGR